MVDGYSSRVILSLGSNLGPSRKLLQNACRDLAVILDRIALSRLYRTTPRDDTEQSDFLNMAVVGYTTAAPQEFLAICRNLEGMAERVRDPLRPKGPRTLDIDLVFFGDLCRSFEPEDLSIPHPRYRERGFVVVPILDVCPDCADPCDGTPLRAMAANLDDQGVYPVGNLTI